jgi:hypothetical protein
VSNPTQINQGGAQNQEKRPPGQTGSANRDKADGELTEGRQEGTQGERAFPDRDPAKKKTGEF